MCFFLTANSNTAVKEINEIKLKLKLKISSDFFQTINLKC